MSFSAWVTLLIFMSEISLAFPIRYPFRRPKPKTSYETMSQGTQTPDWRLTVKKVTNVEEWQTIAAAVAEEFVTEWDNESKIYYAVYDQTRIVGFVIIKPEIQEVDSDLKLMEMDVLHIANDFRRQGYGERVMGFITREGMHKGATHVGFQVLKTDEIALRFFDSIGMLRLDTSNIPNFHSQFIYYNHPV